MIGAKRAVAPRYGDHPALLRAWRDSQSPRTIWRLRYNLTPNDPRVLEATDEEVLEDLLVRRYYDHQLARALNPDIEQDDLARDEKVRAGMMAFKRQVANQDFMAAFRRGIAQHRANRGSKRATSTPPDAYPQIAKLNLKDSPSE